MEDNSWLLGETIIFLVDVDVDVGANDCVIAFE
jgi:hypothetical protein